GDGLRTDAQEPADGRAEVGEALAGPGVVGSAGKAPHQQGRSLARVVGGGVGGITAVVARDEQHASLQGPEQLGKATVDALEATGIALGVAAVPELRVEIDEVRKHERRAGARQVSDRELYAVV